MWIRRCVLRLLAGAVALTLTLAPFGMSYAGNGEGQVTLLTSFIGLFGTGNVYFWTETASNPPSCVANYNRDAKSYRFVFNLNNAEGQAYFQVLMAAKLLGKRIFVLGSG